MIGSFVRYRRDLLVATLPQLVSTLRRLVRLLARLQPELGASQMRFAVNRTPQWIEPNEPLGKDEAATLARLLVSLQVKTVVRLQHGADKAESLARPLSIHAPYILLEYLETVSDPLTTIPIELYRELEPGLFALCAMSSIHARDAIMVSLVDPGQKSALKTLWKDYEKQKYSGKD